MIVLLSLFFAAITPGAEPTMPARFGIGDWQFCTVHERIETLYMFQIIGVVGDPKGLFGTRSITEYDIHKRWLHTLDRDQHS